MTDQKSVNLSGPAIAIAVIVLGAIAAEYWFIPDREPATPSVTVEPVSAPAQSNAAPPSPPPPVSTPDAAPATATASENVEVPLATTWSTYHGGTDLTGKTKLNVSQKPAKRWQYFAEGAVNQAPVGDGNGVYIATRSGNLVALDLEGKERWTKVIMGSGRNGTPAPERFEAPLSLHNGTLFIGSMAGIVHAVDSQTGEPRWQYDVNGEILGAVNFHPAESPSDPGRLFVIERVDGALHCISHDAGTQLWRTDNISRCDGSAAVGNGLVVFGSCACAFHAYGAVDGRRMQNIDLGPDCQVASGPALVGDDIFCGSRLGHFFRANIRTGKIVWTNKDSQKELFTTPAVGDTLVFYGSDDKHIYAVDRETGVQKWKHKTDGTPTSPVIAADQLLFGADGVLIALALDTGEEVWSHEVSDSISSPSVINDLIIVGSEDGTVVAFGSGTT